MKIKNGDKITIKNIGKVAVDIPTFKHNFSYRLSGGESLVFPTKSVEQSLFYLKQKNKILQVTLGNGGEESLTPFRVGQTVSAVKVNTNAKTNEELSTFAAKALEGQGDTKTLVSDSVGTSIVGVQGSAESGYIITAASDTNNNILWVSKGLNLDGKFTFPSAGWYLVNKNDSTFSVTSGIVELPFTGTVAIGENIDAAFNSELNGIVFGVVVA